LWLQNIDSKDLVWKISGIRILREQMRKADPCEDDNKKAKAKKQIPCGDDKKKSNIKKQKAALSAAFSDLYISIVANQVKLTCRDFCTVNSLCFLSVAAISTVLET
jgi:hypothetical protein